MDHNNGFIIFPFRFTFILQHFNNILNNRSDAIFLKINSVICLKRWEINVIMNISKSKIKQNT